MNKTFFSALILSSLILSISSCVRENGYKDDPNKGKDPNNKIEYADSDEIPFADEEFKRMCLEFLTTEDGKTYTAAIDTDNDKKITVKEGKAFTGHMLINIEKKEYDIKSLADLKWFPNIQSFAITSCPDINEIELSYNTNLETLTLFHTNIKEINTDKQEKLKNITISGNKAVEKIDLSKNKNLEFLFLGENENLSSLSTKECCGLEEVIISQNPKLHHWDISGTNMKLNALTIDGTSLSIDPFVKNMKELSRFIYARSLPYEGSIDLSGMHKLEELVCFFDPEKNNVQGLSLPEGSPLRAVTINGSYIEHYDFSSLSELSYCDVNYSAKATGLNLANGNNNNLGFMSALYCPNLKCIQVDETFPLPIDFEELEKGQTYWYVTCDGGVDEDGNPIGNPIPTFDYDCQGKTQSLNISPAIDVKKDVFAKAKLITQTIWKHALQEIEKRTK